MGVKSPEWDCIAPSFFYSLKSLAHYLTCKMLRKQKCLQPCCLEGCRFGDTSLPEEPLLFSLLFSGKKKQYLAMVRLLSKILLLVLLLILLRLVLSICRDESWRQEVKIEESSAIIHSYLYKPPFSRDYFSL